MRQFVIAALGSVVAVLSVMVWYQGRQLEMWQKIRPAGIGEAGFIGAGSSDGDPSF